MEIEFAACSLIEFYKEEGNTFGTSVLFLSYCSNEYIIIGEGEREEGANSVDICQESRNETDGKKIGR